MKTILIKNPYFSPKWESNSKINWRFIFYKLIWRLQFVKKTYNYTKSNDGGRCVNCDGGSAEYHVECCFFRCPCNANQQLKRKYHFIHFRDIINH